MKFKFRGKSYMWKPPIWMHIIVGIAVVCAIWWIMALSYAINPELWVI